jgi:hypothetical protein
MAANATAVWRVRPSGNNQNGGGYDPGISGAGTDYSQQNAAQVTQSGGTVSTATTTLTDTGATFTSALIGNAIRLNGSGITGSFYTFIIAVPTGTTLTLQTSPGTSATGVTYSIGGGWSDFWTNTTAALAIVVPGNIIYILGSGTPNPSSYVYDYTAVSFLSAIGDTTNGRIVYANDPSTPGYKAPPDTTGGMPVIKAPTNVFNNTGFTSDYIEMQGLWFVANSSSGQLVNQNSYYSFLGCVLDQFGQDYGLVGSNCSVIQVAGCEVYSSVAAGAGIVTAVPLNSGIIAGCNIHDTIAAGVSGGTVTIASNIIAKCNGDGIIIGLGSATSVSVFGNTVDGNAGHGINLNSATPIVSTAVFNNIFSNHVGSGKAGLRCGSGTAAANVRIAGFIDYNSFYNNTANYSAFNASPHDTALSVTPYVNSATENYSLI